jgi:hypothetical protein
MDPLITIAIPDLDGPAPLDRTRVSVARHTPEAHAVVPLGAAAAPSLPAPAAEPPPDPIGVLVPFGTPAAVNHLLVVAASPYLLLLESGAVVTHGRLRRLLALKCAPDLGDS